MSIMRKDVKSGYTHINNEVFKSGLSLKAQGLLCNMLHLPDNWVFSVQGLQKIVPDGKDAIRSALKELEIAGFIDRGTRKRLDDGTFSETDWVIRDYSSKKASMSDYPMAENPTLDNPTLENPPLINTNRITTERVTTNNTTTTTTDGAKLGGETESQRDAEISPYWQNTSESETGATEREQERESSAKERERELVSVFRMASGRSTVSPAERLQLRAYVHSFRADLIHAAIMDAAMCGADKVNISYIDKILARCKQDGITDADSYAKAKLDRKSGSFRNTAKKDEQLKDW